jgi:hypothetical protein
LQLTVRADQNRDLLRPDAFTQQAAKPCGHACDLSIFSLKFMDLRDRAFEDGHHAGAPVLRPVGLNDAGRQQAV